MERRTARGLTVREFERVRCDRATVHARSAVSRRMPECVRLCVLLGDGVAAAGVQPADIQTGFFLLLLLAALPASGLLAAQEEEEEALHSPG